MFKRPMIETERENLADKMHDKLEIQKLPDKVNWAQRHNDDVMFAEMTMISE